MNLDSARKLFSQLGKIIPILNRVDRRLDQLKKAVKLLEHVGFESEYIRVFVEHGMPEELKVAVADAKRNINRKTQGVRVQQPQKRHPRFEAVDLVDVHFKVSDKRYSGSIKNISARGMCLTTDEKVDIGQQIQIIVNDFDSKALTGVVKWTEGNDTNQGALLGIQLNENLITPG